MAGVVTTKQDPRLVGWALQDRVVRLRYWGTPTTICLDGASEWTLGAGPDATIRIDDPSGRVSRRHATLALEEGVWTVRDLGSTNGTKHDGETRITFQLSAADVLELGPVRLVAESEGSIRLHGLLQRWLGWSEERLPEVDRALAAVREMAALRTMLVLRGDRRSDQRRAAGAGLLHGFVRRLHDMVLGDERPLAFRAADEPARDALARARDGLLCVDAKHTSGMAQIVAASRLPDVRVRLVICTAREDDAAELLATLPRSATVSLPSLADRVADFERLLVAYGGDAVRELGAEQLAFRPHDAMWVREAGVRTLDELEEVARRLVALRNWGVGEGAKRLGLTHGALSQWARARRIPT